MDRLDQLRVFSAVVEHGSFSRAARALSVGQPAVSKAIAALEGRLRTRLVQRTTRRLTVTDAGRRYHEHVKQLIDSLAQAEADLAEDREPRGTLRLHGPVVLGELLLGPVAVEFQAAHPAVRCELTLLDAYVDLVAEGADLAIRLGEVEGGPTVRRRLGTMERLLVATPRVLRQLGPLRQVEDLARARSVRFSGLPGGDAVEVDGEVVHVPSAFVANNAVVLRQALLGGLGVGVVTRWLVSADLESGALVEVLPGRPLAPLEVSAIFPSPRFIPARARRYVEVLLVALRSFPGTTVPPRP